MQHADVPLLQWATLGLQPVAHKLLLISRPAEGRRLSWPECAALAPVCLRMAQVQTATWKLTCPILYHCDWLSSGNPDFILIEACMSHCWFQEQHTFSFVLCWRKVPLWCRHTQAFERGVHAVKRHHHIPANVLTNYVWPICKHEQWAVKLPCITAPRCMCTIQYTVCKLAHAVSLERLTEP